MSVTTVDVLRYPVGQFQAPENYMPEQLNAWIDGIASFPAQLRAEVEHLTQAELALTYRPGGWNIRQVVHHCADSHMNAFIRFKLALTETKPTIKPYREDLWAQLPDTLELPVSPSLQILEGVHHRWATLLRTLQPAQWQSGYIHPEYGKHVPLNEALGSYDWHCRHHLAHVRAALSKG